MKKRVISAVLALFMLLSAIPASAETEWHQSGSLLSVTGSGAMPDMSAESAAPWDDDIKTVAIGEGVTAVGAYSFYFSHIDAVLLPESLESIGAYAFAGCDALKTLSVPDGVAGIGEGAFMLSAIEDITLPKSLKMIPKELLRDCTGIKSVAIPDGVESIGLRAFCGCVSLESCAIPDGVTSIGQEAFRACRSLREISIPASVKSIGSDVFYSCSSLKTIKFGGSAEQWAALGVKTDADVIFGVHTCSYTLKYDENFHWYECNCGQIKDRAEHNYVNHACTVCGAKDPRHVHAFNERVTLPTCTAGGYTTYTCACGESYVADQTPALVHETALQNFRPAKCDEAGYTGDEVCTRCGEVQHRGEAIKALGHDFKNGKCTRCGAVDENYVPPKTRNFPDVHSGDYYAPAVNWAVANGVTDGFPDGEFKPGDPCTRAQIVTFLWRAAGKPKAQSAAGFPDVPRDIYYHDAVAWASERGITNGFPDGTFKPNDTCTRAQIVTFLWRSQSTPAPSGTGSFPDVPRGIYYHDAVQWAVERGITNGFPGGVFLPDDPCTRAQAVTFLYRAR